MALALLVAVALSWTNPTHLGPGCEPSEVEMTDLQFVEVWGVPAGSTQATMLTKVDAEDREGMVESAMIDVAGQWTVWVVAVNDRGARSCPSNYIGVNVPPVTVGPPSPGEPVYYDLTGRRVDKPTAPGVYFERKDGRTRRVVVLR